MKRIVVVILLCCFFSSQIAFAQYKAFRFGLKVAPNIGWVSPDTDDYLRQGTSPGFSWGFVSDFAITENYHVGTGFNINYLNGEISYPHLYVNIENDDTTNYSGTLSRKMKFRYIELPLTLKMKTNKFDMLQIYGQIGFSLGFNLKAKADENFSETGGAFTYSKEDRDISDDIHLLKGSLILGGGIEYYLDNSTSLIGGITFYNGISNVLKGYSSTDPTMKQKATPHYIELTLGVIF
jgi:hypothetical protein